MKLSLRSSLSRRGATAALSLLTLLPIGLVTSPLDMAKGTLWLAVETTVALSVSFAFGLFATLGTGAEFSDKLELFASRGLELTAALPIVLAASVLVAVVQVPMPIAVAFVIGVLGGLRCMRVVATWSRRRADLGTEGPGARRHLLWHSIELSVLATLPTVVEQVVGLEAAIAWLDPLDRPWAGGWGERLGRYARLGDLSLLGLWTLAAVGLAVALKLLTWHSPAPSEAEQIS